LEGKGLEIPNGELTFLIDGNGREYWSKSSLAIFEALLLLKKSELQPIKPQRTLSRGSFEDMATAETLNNTSFSLANRAISAIALIDLRLKEIELGTYGTFEGKLIDADRLIVAPMSGVPIEEKEKRHSPRRITTHVTHYALA
jgi:RNA polymerase-binding transcription factor DksA